MSVKTGFFQKFVILNTVALSCESFRFFDVLINVVTETYNCVPFVFGVVEVCILKVW